MRSTCGPDPDLVLSLNLEACGVRQLKLRCKPEGYKQIRRGEHDGVPDATRERLERIPDAMKIRRQTTWRPFGTIKPDWARRSSYKDPKQRSKPRPTCRCWLQSAADDRHLQRVPSDQSQASGVRSRCLRSQRVLAQPSPGITYIANSETGVVDNKSSGCGAVFRNLPELEISA